MESKLISSKIVFNLIFSQETGTIWDFIKTSYNTYSRPNQDGTITFYTSGVIEIQDEYYEFNFQRIFKVSFTTQEEYNSFISETLEPLDKLIFKGHGENSQAQILD